MPYYESKITNGNILTMLLLLVGLVTAWFAYGNAATSADVRSKANSARIKQVEHTQERSAYERKAMVKQDKLLEAYLKAIANHLDVEVVFPESE